MNILSSTQVQDQDHGLIIEGHLGIMSFFISANAVNGKSKIEKSEIFIVLDNSFLNINCV